MLSILPARARETATAIGLLSLCRLLYTLQEGLPSAFTHCGLAHGEQLEDHAEQRLLVLASTFSHCQPGERAPYSVRQDYYLPTTIRKRNPPPAHSSSTPRSTFR